MHPWNLTVDEAERLQKSLAEDCVLEGDPDVQTVAGVDISMEPESELGLASAVLYSVERETVLREVVLLGDLTFPYVPGLLAFREAPLMMRALMQLDREPDCLLIDGHGYAHPRRFGLASHLGLLMECPSIGCAKSLLVGEYDEPGEAQGYFTDVWDGEPIGYALRSRRDANPIFLSPGHRISRENVLPLIRNLLDGRTKLPEPVHRADRIAGNQRRFLRNLTEPFVERDIGVFLVGGALRDLLSGRHPSDYDLLVTDFPEEVRDELGEEYDSHFFELDEEREVYRMMAERIQLDVSVVGENEVVDDLMRRDFTINSIALDMNRENWVDPRSGREDIKQERIHPTGEDSLWNDPLRLLRAYRFGSDLGFELSDRITEEIPEIGTRLEVTPRERIVAELFKITELSDLVQCLRSMDEDGVLDAVGFLRAGGVGEVAALARWILILEGYDLFEGDYHGGYSLLAGLQVGRLIEPDRLDEWPLHGRVSKITQASYRDLEETPDCDVLTASRWELVGRLMGRAFEGDWSSDQYGQALSRLQRYLRDRELLEKEVVSGIKEDADRKTLVETKQAALETELPGLWANRVAPVFSY